MKRGSAALVLVARAGRNGATGDCTYDMDLWLDDRPARGKDGTRLPAVPAGDVIGGKRQRLVPACYAPDSGSHHFELHRFRTCADGKRELVGVACLEAVLE